VIVMASSNRRIAADTSAAGRGGIDELVLSCYARGMTTRDIEAHLREVYGLGVSRELIWRDHRRGG